MDYNNIRKLVREIQNDKSLNQAEKNQKIQKVMMSQYKNAIETEEEKPIEEECPHYQRGCLVKCDKCKLYVNCRLCHPEMDRFKINNVKCKKCLTIQLPPFSNTCTNCDHIFGKYFCDICNLFMNKDKDVFHCNDCGICRIGTQENLMHCHKCNACVNKVLHATSKCFENSWNNLCPICQESMHQTTIPTSLLECGHAIHSECLKNYVKHDYRCPTCMHSITDMTGIWDQFRNQLTTIENQIQQQIQINDNPDFNPLNMGTIDLICNDCNKHFSKNKSIVRMYECPNCKGFNTN